MALHARIAGAADRASNGKQPTNVPALTLKGQIDHDLGAVPGLTVFAATTLESRRMVLPDNSLAVPGWTRWDLGARYTLHIGATTLTWRAAVDNATDRRAWRESPFQYGHSYLFPLPPRSWRLSVQAEL
jgi:iron complex outermembrane receptor protein